VRVQGRPRLRVGISRCLLGEAVRFDGGHKHDPYITETLGRFFEWVPVCPEVETGLGTPRESMRLVGTVSGIRLIARNSKTDHTEAMNGFCARRLEELAGMGLRGFILKKDSPSCGLMRVPVHGRGGGPGRAGRGLFASALLKRFPILPAEEEARLHDMALRENFIERVFAFDRWLDFVESNPRPKELVEFHRRHKLALLSHSRQPCQDLGRIVAAAGEIPMNELLSRYALAFAAAMAVKTTPAKHAEVLRRIYGCLKKRIEGEDRAEVVGRIEQYRKGMAPLIVPLTLLQHHSRRNPVPWMEEQTYLNPCPAELFLRNHV